MWVNHRIVAHNSKKFHIKVKWKGLQCILLRLFFAIFQIGAQEAKNLKIKINLQESVIVVCRDGREEKCREYNEEQPKLC